MVLSFFTDYSVEISAGMSADCLPFGGLRLNTFGDCPSNHTVEPDEEIVPDAIELVCFLFGCVFERSLLAMSADNVSALILPV